jgi:hypothetical protein
MVSATPAQAAALPQVTAIECAKHPGLFDLVYISNVGDAAMDLGGWQLRSDPEGAEQMALAPAGLLDPGEQIIIAAGAHGVNLPNENLYLWTNAEVLRDGGEPADYAKLYDAGGGFVSGLDCTGRALTAAAPGPAPAPAAAAPASQGTGTTQASAQQPASSASRQASAAKAVPNSGGAAADDGAGLWWIIGGALAFAGGALVMAGAGGELMAVRMNELRGKAGPRRR